MMRRTSPPPPAQKASSVFSTHLRRGPASPRSWRETNQATFIRTEVSTSGYRARELCLSASASGYSSSAAIRSRSSRGRERSGKKEVAKGGVGFARVPDGGVIEVGLGREGSVSHALEKGFRFMPLILIERRFSIESVGRERSVGLLIHDFAAWSLMIICQGKRAKDEK